MSRGSLAVRLGVNFGFWECGSLRLRETGLIVFGRIAAGSKVCTEMCGRTRGSEERRSGERNRAKDDSLKSAISSLVRRKQWWTQCVHCLCIANEHTGAAQLNSFLIRNRVGMQIHRLIGDQYRGKRRCVHWSAPRRIEFPHCSKAVGQALVVLEGKPTLCGQHWLLSMHQKQSQWANTPSVHRPAHTHPCTLSAP